MGNNSLRSEIGTIQKNETSDDIGSMIKIGLKKTQPQSYHIGRGREMNIRFRKKYKFHPKCIGCISTQYKKQGKLHIKLTTKIL